MSLTTDGAEMTKVYLDETEMLEVYIDEVLIWSKPTTESGWVLNWSGTQYVGMRDEQITFLINGYMNGSITDGMYEEVEVTSDNFSGASNTSSGLIHQANANYIEIGIYPNGADEVVHSETLTAPRNNNSKVSNLPWEPSYNYVQISSILDAPIASGNNLTQTALVGWSAGMGYLFFSMFEVSALYYYKE